MAAFPLLGGVVLSVSDFVAMTNQIFENVLASVTIRGELANFRVSKGKWVYFDLKDENATVRFFGSVFVLHGPLEDGMLLLVSGTPKLHPLYGFSITVTSLRPEGEGTIRRSFELLKAKLEAEGLFDPLRKRVLPYPPARIGLITSTESAAYADFVKILHARWRGVAVECVDVQVQGEVAPVQIIAALEYLNQQARPPEVIVLTRGGGSAEDLYAFSTEQVTRAVASSRVPTLVAIGHEIDLSLAELVADQRASTPSNAAELLVPDRYDIQAQLVVREKQLYDTYKAQIREQLKLLEHATSFLKQVIAAAFRQAHTQLLNRQQLLNVLNPRAVLNRGYAIVRSSGKPLTHRRDATSGVIVNVEVSDGQFNATVN